MLLLTRDKRINILDKKLSAIKNDKIIKPVNQNEHIEIHNNGLRSLSCPYCEKCMTTNKF